MPDEAAVEKPDQDLAADPSSHIDRLQIIAVVIALKIVLFLFAGQTYQVLTDKSLVTLFDWLHIWHRWDALHYQKLAEFGYTATGPMRPSMVFYPLYPWLIRLFTFLTNDYVVSSFIISAAATVVACVIFYNLIRLEYSRQTALCSVWFLVIFPTSYFLHIGYTESLFLALALGCIYSARTNNWMLAGIIGALACLTRANGLVLIPALGIEIIHQFWTTRRWRSDWLWVVLIPLGFCGYLAVIGNAAGDPFAFMAIRTEAFYISTAPPWTGVMLAIGQIGGSPVQAQIVGVQEFTFIVLGFVCAIFSWFKLRPIYSVWITCCWLLVVSVNYVASVPRYTLTMFPIFILFALLARQRFWLAVITVWSLVYLGFFSALFTSGRWAF